MNYYWWKSDDDKAGNVCAKDEKEAIEKAGKAFNVKVTKVKLLKENIEKNPFTGQNYK